MKKKQFAITITGIFLIVIFCGMADAKEPTIPKVDKYLGSEKEEEISKLKKFSIDECFEKLKELEFLLADDYFNKAAYECFKKSKQDAIEYAIDHLKQPAKTVEGDSSIWNDNHYVARTVMKVFASEAENKLLNAYKKGDAQTRANILYVMGPMASKKAKILLIEALDDKTVYEEIYFEIDGEPLRVDGEAMRVCDMAYNQLRLRYAEELVDLPRTISNSHMMEIRDDYIDEMKSRF